MKKFMNTENFFNTSVEVFDRPLGSEEWLLVARGKTKSKESDVNNLLLQKILSVRSDWQIINESKSLTFLYFLYLVRLIQIMRFTFERHHNKNSFSHKMGRSTLGKMVTRNQVCLWLGCHVGAIATAVVVAIMQPELSPVAEEEAAPSAAALWATEKVIWLEQFYAETWLTVGSNVGFSPELTGYAYYSYNSANAAADADAKHCEAKSF